MIKPSEGGKSSTKKDTEIEKLFDTDNRKISRKLLVEHYNSSLNQALNITRQKKTNVNDFEEEDRDQFYQAVYKLTASNLWKLFNPKRGKDGNEETWVDSYGGVLYIQAKTELDKFKIEFNTASCYLADE